MTFEGTGGDIAGYVGTVLERSTDGPWEGLAPSIPVMHSNLQFLNSPHIRYPAGSFLGNLRATRTSIFPRGINIVALSSPCPHVGWYKYYDRSSSQWA